MMQRWKGKVAIVTGASGGIGATVASLLIKDSVKVIGLARRKEKLDELVKVLGENKFFPVECDLRKEDDVVIAFNWIEERFGGADILVNNAAVADQSRIIETTGEDYKRTLETNVVAPAICTREFVNSIKKRKTSGHIININSMAGHYAETIELPIGMYAASKYALNALTTELRLEIKEAGLNIKLTSISPGAVLTDMLKTIIRSEATISQLPSLSVKDVADAVMYALSTPPGVEVYDLFLMSQNASLNTKKTKEDEAQTSKKTEKKSAE